MTTRTTWHDVVYTICQLEKLQNSCQNNANMLHPCIAYQMHIDGQILKNKSRNQRLVTGTKDFKHQHAM